MGLIENLQLIKEKVQNGGSGGSKVMGVTYLSDTFKLNYNLTELDISNFDDSELVGLDYTFYRCENLIKITSNWKTLKLKNMYSTFAYCYDLEEVDISNWNTKNVTNMTWCFYNCYKLKDIKIDITNLKSADNIFYCCSSLTNLDFTGTENVQVDIDLSTTGLDATGLMNMLDTLPTLDHSQTFTIGSKKMELLTEEQIAEFTIKGYTLA